MKRRTPQENKERIERLVWRVINGESLDSLGLNRNDRYRVVLRLRELRPDLLPSHRRRERRDRILRYLWKRRKKGFLPGRVLKKLDASWRDLYGALVEKLGERRAKRFIRHSIEKYWEYKYTHGKRVRSALWERDIKDRGLMGFDFTGPYWNRYYKMWKNKRRKDCPVDEDGRPDYVATMLRR